MPTAIASKKTKATKTPGQLIGDIESGKTARLDYATAAAIHRELGWPPPVLCDNAIAAPTPASTAAWASLTPELRMALTIIIGEMWKQPRAFDVFAATVEVAK